MKKNKRFTCIARNTVFGLSLTAFGTMSGIAIGQESVDEIQEVMVTGSRIKTAVVDGASPITSITAEDMRIEGDFTVADALRESTLNSHGSYSEASGSSYGANAGIDLRGAGLGRTLVLMDGRRMPGSPTFGGGAANINAIPMAAVERLEVMTDGGSSVYGSDAVAGVVNVILKDDFEGLEITVGAGDRDQDPGLDSKEFSLIGGWNSDRGNVTVAFDHQQRDGISDGDRSYTSAWMRDLDGDGTIQAYSETDGYSIYGATIASPDKESASASKLCSSLGEPFVEVAADDDWAEGSTYCMYPYANVSYNKRSTDRNSLFVNMDYAITDDIEWFGRAMIVQSKSFGRFAPPAAGWDTITADNPHNPYGEETSGYFRWVGIGTRDANTEDTNEDYLFGLRGDNGSLNWEVYYHENITDNKDIGEYYLSYGGLQYNIENGIELDSEEGIANMSATTLVQNRGTFKQYFGGAGFDKFAIGGRDISHYAGMEYFEQTYSSTYDAQSAADLVGGFAGNSAAGERDVTAVFYESRLPVTEDIEVNFSIRYDRYSDFGSELSPKVSARWAVNEQLVLRTSFSEGFRAPQLDELYAATSFSAEDTIDYVQCETTGVSDADCNERQVDTYYRSNDQLEAETSEYFNLGLVWTPVDAFNLSLDYFDLAIDNVIQTQTVQSLVNKERAGTLVNDDVFYIKRNAAGRIEEAGTGYNNGAERTITGIDLNMSAIFDTSVGTISASWDNSFMLSYDDEVSYEGPIQDQAGWYLMPDYRSTFTGSWSLDEHSLAYTAKFIDSTYGRTEAVEGTEMLRPIDSVDSWLVHDLTYTYDMSDRGRVTLSALNITDEDPVLDINDKYSGDLAELYDKFGREYRISYTIAF